MSEPTRSAGDSYGGLEVLFEFIEAGSEPADLLEVSEGSFYAVALAIERTVEGALDIAHGSRCNHSLDVAFGEMAEDRVGIVALVGQDRFGPTVAEQCDGLGAVVGLAASQHKAEG